MSTRVKNQSLPIAERWKPVEHLRLFLKEHLPPNSIRLISKVLRPERAVRAQLARWRRRRRLLPTRLHRSYARLWDEALRRWSSGFTEPTGPPIQLPITPNGPTVAVRPGTSDILVYEDVIVQERYGRAPLESVRTIVDCGANIGLTSAYLLSRYPDARVIALEPDPVNFEACRKNLEQFGDRALVRQAALWGTPSTMSVSASSKAGTWASTVVPQSTGTQAGGHLVPGMDMPSLLAEHEIDLLDILKIDIEGAEAQVFGNADLGWLARVKCLMIELENRETEAIFFEAVAGEPLTFFRTGDVTIALRDSVTE